MDRISPRMRWIMAVTALVVVGVWLSRAGAERGDTAASTQLFYDTVTGVLFEAPADQHAPIESPAGHEAVRAVFFVCEGADERFLGYYEKYTPEAKVAMTVSVSDGDRADQLAALSRGRLISKDAKQWFSADAPEAKRMARDVHARCDGKAARLWHPE